MQRPSDLTALIHQVDWAFAFGDRERMVSSCRELADVADASIAPIVLHIATTAEHDLARGRALWVEVARQLRGMPPRTTSVPAP